MTKSVAAKDKRKYNPLFQHTLDHLSCPACEAAQRLGMRNALAGSSLVKQAAWEWLETRKPYIGPSTVEAYEQYITAFMPFMGEITLEQVHVGHIREYQKWRSKKAGVRRINHEMNTLAQILARAGLWAELEDSYEPLPLPRWVAPKVMTDEEEQRLYRVGASNPNWAVAYWVMVLCANTTAASCEIRGLRLKNIDLKERILFVPSDFAKNEFRARVIPLNEPALESATALYYRAVGCGASDPMHFIIPFRLKRNRYDVTRAASRSFIKTAFKEIKIAADLPWLTPHCLRHHSITRLLEQPTVSEETVKSIAGHVSKNILQTYSHVRIQAKREALDAMNNTTKAYAAGAGKN